MTGIWHILYNVFVIPLLKLFFLVARLFNPKIRKGIKDRKRLFENLIVDLADIDRTKKMVWFHSASMGEFEQAKPIIERLKKESPVNIIVTFFSPSGYQNSLKYPNADVIAYIPFDTPKLVNRFLKLTKPNLAVFMRYDIWPNTIWRLKSLKIPSIIVDATMLPDSKRKWLISKGFHKSLYSNITRILTVSEEDKVNFQDFEISDERLKSVGDTRFDRVKQKSLQAQNKKLFKDGFFKNKKVFVFGSSWESDEEVMLPALLKLLEQEKNIILLVVPHEPTVIHLEKLEHTISEKFKTIRFSYLNNYKKERVIIIDSIGILLTLYYYADAAYLGGSFKQGIHNVLEPAVYGIPVMYGPKFQNSREAGDLLQNGGGILIRNRREAYRKLRKIMSDDELRKQLGKICYDYVNSNTGATEKILQEIKQFIS